MIACCFDQFRADPASTVFRVTGHQLIALCKAVCEEEKAQMLDPPMKSWYQHFSVSGVALYPFFIVFFVFTELGDVLERLQQGPSQPSRQVVEITDISGDESVVRPRGKKFL